MILVDDIILLIHISFRTSLVERRPAATISWSTICSSKKRSLRAISSIRLTWGANVRWKALWSGFKSLNWRAPTSPRAQMVSRAASVGIMSWKGRALGGF